MYDGINENLQDAETASPVQALAPLYEKLKDIIPPAEWALFAPDILAIQKLKKEKNALILAHNYMTPEIFFGVADIVGDSLALAREAAKSTAEVIVVAGVAFMAETAKILNPSRTVLSPDLEAGCSLASAITAEDVRALRKAHPGVPIVAYVNTSAAVKAEVDICCTSANAAKVVSSLGAPEVLMVPDEYLALNVARETGLSILTYKGWCEVHKRFSADEVRALRAQHPGLAVLIHPECAPDVVAEGDFSGSTGGMSAWIKANKPEKALLLTECSMSDNVAVENAGTSFVRPCALCPHMKRITLPKIRASLEGMIHEILVPEDVAVRARRSIERMMEAS